MSKKPTIYIFHGEDEFGIATEIANLKARLGEEHPIDMDFTVLEQGAYSLEDLQAIALTIPFLTSRRLVVVNNPLKQFSRGNAKTRFQNLLESIPETTALVIVETSSLRRDHWLLEWARSKSGKVYERNFAIQTGASMAVWIQQRAEAQGREITRQAADALAELVGSQKRQAAQEVDKLLAYTEYQRAIEVEDVHLLSTGIEEEALSEVFDMVDTLGQRRPQDAMDALQKLLQVYDPGYLFYMIVRQFRFLILGREAFDNGLTGADLAQQLNIKPWLASKILTQARNFDIATLEEIYRQLLDLDQGIKTGQSDYSLALDLLVAGS